MLVALPSGNSVEAHPLRLQDFLEAEGELKALAARVASFTSDEVSEWLDEGDQLYLLRWGAEHLSEEDAHSLAFLAEALHIIPSQYLLVPEMVAGFYIDKRVTETLSQLKSGEGGESNIETSPTASGGYMEDPI